MRILVVIQVIVTHLSGKVSANFDARNLRLCKCANKCVGLHTPVCHKVVEIPSCCSEYDNTVLLGNARRSCRHDSSCRFRFRCPVFVLSALYVENFWLLQYDLVIFYLALGCILFCFLFSFSSSCQLALFSVAVSVSFFL